MIAVDSRTKGYLMVISSSTLWGLSGTAAQFLFHNYSVQPGLLVELRMLFSGIILLGLFHFSVPSGERNKGRVTWEERVSIVILGTIGLLTVQLTYFLAIDFSNAGTATLLQYTAPFFMMAWLFIIGSKQVLQIELLSVLVAMGGLFLLLTDGSLSGIKVSEMAVLWGVLSAMAAAFYTLYPYRLINRFDTRIITGWGMLTGSLFLMPLYPPWKFGSFHIDLLSIVLVLFVIVLGTAVPFLVYLGSLKYIKPSNASILTVFEPLSAVSVTVLVLGTRLGILQIMGGVLIVISTVILGRQGSRQVQKHG